MMKKSKKVVATALTMSFAASMLTPVNAALDPSVWEARDKEGINARFALFSDYHLINDASRLEIALDAFTNIGGIDGIMQVGDQIYMNQANVLMPELYEGINMVFEGYEDLTEVPNAIIMGNHEFPLSATDKEICAEAREMFVEGLGINEDRIGIIDLHTEEDGVPYADAAYDMAGYTVVAVSSMDYLNTISPQSEAWAKEQIEAALADDPNKPVFYLQHQCFQDTVRHGKGNKQVKHI